MTPRPRPRWRELRGEHGSASVLIVGLCLALAIAIAVAVDGTRKAQAASDATAVAEEAARAGGQALRAHALATGQDATVTPGLAAAEARRYLSATGTTGTVAVQGTRIVVDTTIVKPTLMLGLIGISTVTVHGHGAATLISVG